MNRKNKKKFLYRVNKVVFLNCGAERCRTCGTPNWDGGDICGNCGEDPKAKPVGTLPFDPFFNQYVK
ncbi:MAG: hypothetical protein UV53_C0009G0007 [Candidatus Azambacteria bacterium GW2011_GWE1_42_9]|nr:MAG: hypothetical protein UU33_C0001G0463 [Candidatus Azambacteria bacterium GW2011_GWF1_41_10]KKS49497.1 MAG: hypothetical protein UV14_C0001G0243 [Candidatus Azambacteria bacterium GW2011_GWF2_42_22]KKS69276.1 MAG: hypothetical protein UV39_C0015G0001 [Candidatus Azambacteria bacterium GW2011_GWA2_42_62]KKS74110.1 MAG: hypothetical protein UV45_C0012G0006 [Candidatus Azambacteria bacterium GW2011_GWB1_42_72]KKS79318.1 MAG: hypothetical protein UV53_C0009G0007 [Candidatus Azambacteria bacte